MSNRGPHGTPFSLEFLKLTMSKIKNAARQWGARANVHLFFLKKVCGFIRACGKEKNRFGIIVTNPTWGMQPQGKVPSSRSRIITWRHVDPDPLLMGTRLGLKQHVYHVESPHFQVQAVAGPSEDFCTVTDAPWNHSILSLACYNNCVLTQGSLRKCRGPKAAVCASANL